MIDITTLQDEIVADLTTELSGEESFNLDALTIKVKLAIKEVMSKRSYENSSLDDESILADLTNHFYSTIANVARYDYNQIGAEGQDSHSENSISRKWVDRNSLFQNVHAFVKVYSR